MKKILFLSFLLASVTSFAQFSNYTNINGRYKWIAGKFDSTFTIPTGTTPSLRTGGANAPGAMFYRTTDSTIYQYTGTQWIKLRGGISPTDTAGLWITDLYRRNGTDSVFYVKGGSHTFAFRDSVGNAGGGGGGGKIYYFNGGVSMGTIGGLSMYELGDTANTGAAANFTRATTGNLANFITDPGKPGLLQIPAGVWTVDAYLSETGGGANHAQIWIEVEKWDGSTITTIATSPIEEITNGSVIDLYTWSVSIPTTSLAITDRIVIQFYISNTNGKTVTLYTQNGYVGEVHTTFTTGIGSLNGLTAPSQFFATGTSGTDFNIASATATHTFNLPTASATNRGALSTTDWTTFNNKIGQGGTPIGANYYAKWSSSNEITGSILTDNNSSSLLWRGIDFSVGDNNTTLKELKLNFSFGNFAIGGSTNEYYLYGFGSKPMTFSTSGTEAMRLTASGNFGIGTNNPLSKFVVSNGGAAGMEVVPGSGLASGGTFIQHYNRGVGAYVPSTTYASTHTFAVSSGPVMSVYAPANVIIGSAALDSMFIVADGTHLKRGVRMSGLPTGVGTKALRINANGTLSIADTLANGISGTGTTNYIPKFTSSSAIGNSLMQEVASGISFGGPIYAQDGTSTSASIRFYNSNSGLYHTGSDGLGFITNASEKMRLDASGNLGLGTSSPAERLEVSASNVMVKLNAATNTFAQLGYYENGSLKWNAYNDYNTDNYVLGNSGGSRLFLTQDGNLGLGVTPSAWNGLASALQIQNASIVTSSIGAVDTYFSSNAYWNGGWKYILTNSATQYIQNAVGNHIWNIAPSGTAGNAISWTQAMTLDASGRLLVGGTSASGAKLQVFPSTQYTAINSTDGLSIYNPSSTGANIILGINGSSANIIQSRDGLSTAFPLAINPFGGNVGIGTTSPESITTYRTLQVTGGSTTTGGIFTTTNSDETVKARFLTQSGQAAIGTVTNHPVLFLTNDTERMRITSGGNVGIGTSSPQRALNIVSNNAQIRISDAVAPTTNYWEFYSTFSNTNQDLFIQNQNGTALTINSSGSVGIGTISPGAKLSVSNGTVEAQINPVSGVAYFGTISNHPVAISTNATERMRITSGGELLINTTSDAGDYKLQVNGNVYAAGNQLNYTSGTSINNTLQFSSSNVDGQIRGNFALTTGVPSSVNVNDTYIWRIAAVGGAGNTGNYNNNLKFLRTTRDGVTDESILSLNGYTGNAEFYGSIKTAAPSGGTAKPWKLGTVATVSPTSPDRTIEVEIDGVTYYIHAKTTNN